MTMRRSRLAGVLFLLATSIASTGRIAAGQQPKRLDSFQLARAHMMLRTVYDEIRKNYYDPTFHGVALENTYARVDNALDNSATNTDAFFLIATFVSTLQDSHTFFVPPERIRRMDRGFQMEPIGDACFVTRVRPKTDAALKLHPGDRIVSINGYAAERRSYQALDYLFQIQAPTPTLTMVLVDPKGAQRTEVVKASFRVGKDTVDLSGEESSEDNHRLTIEEENEAHRNRERMVNSGDILIWKMPDFNTSDDAINSSFGYAKKHGTLILDLRGNPGGSEDILKLMVTHVFNREIKLADRVSRKDTKPVMVKASNWGAYNGKIMVLIDGTSGSAAELFARVMQLEHRGLVIGDRSAGAVMEARQYIETVGNDTLVPYSLSVTSANLLMTDGKSLEKVGVIPDVHIVPTAAEMAAGDDPVLARAVAMAGGTMDASTAGGLFPYEWPTL
jgi:C-terminal processing protease CtpA/Prc